MKLVKCPNPECNALLEVDEKEALVKCIYCGKEFNIYEAEVFSSGDGFDSEKLFSSISNIDVLLQSKSLNQTNISSSDTVEKYTIKSFDQEDPEVDTFEEVEEESVFLSPNSNEAAVLELANKDNTDTAPVTKENVNAETITKEKTGISFLSKLAFITRSRIILPVALSIATIATVGIVLASQATKPQDAGTTLSGELTTIIADNTTTSEIKTTDNITIAKSTTAFKATTTKAASEGKQITSVIQRETSTTKKETSSSKVETTSIQAETTTLPVSTSEVATLQTTAVAITETTTRQTQETTARTTTTRQTVVTTAATRQTQTTARQAQTTTRQTQATSRQTTTTRQTQVTTTTTKAPTTTTAPISTTTPTINTKNGNFYELSSDNVLTIKGPGELPFVYWPNYLSWNQHTTIKTVVLEEGITSIGAWFHDGLYSIETVYFPHSLKHIGIGCFNGSSTIREIIYNGTKSEWNKIEKESRRFSESRYYRWDSAIGHLPFSYTIKCLDGDISINYDIHQFGENLWWSYDADSKTLTLTGSGRGDICLNAFHEELESPFLENVIISEGITYYEGNILFLKANNISLPSTLEKTDGEFMMGGYAPNFTIASGSKFYFDTTNKILIDTETKTLVKGWIDSTIPNDGSVEIIGEGAFSCFSSNLNGMPLLNTQITIPVSIKEVSKRSFYYIGKNIDLFFESPSTIIYDEPYTICESSQDYIIIHGYKGSTAEAYAQKYGIPFIEIE